MGGHHSPKTAKDLRCHALKRAALRYPDTLTARDIVTISGVIQRANDGSGGILMEDGSIEYSRVGDCDRIVKLVRESNTRSHWMVEYKGNPSPLYCVYNHTLKTIATILTAEMSHHTVSELRQIQSAEYYQEVTPAVRTCDPVEMDDFIFQMAYGQRQEGSSQY